MKLRKQYKLGKLSAFERKYYDFRYIAIQLEEGEKPIVFLINQYSNLIQDYVKMPFDGVLLSQQF